MSLANVLLEFHGPDKSHALWLKLLIQPMHDVDREPGRQNAMVQSLTAHAMVVPMNLSA